jgi:putative ABC transport system permease protein
MRTLLQDLRYASRMLRKTPALTAAAVVSLALGIGANTAIFSVVNSILLKSLPYQEPDRLVLLWGDIPAEGKTRSQVSATDVDDWQHQNSVFEDVTTYANWNATLVGAGEPERLTGIQVGDGFFPIMRAAPLLGRTFLPEEQQPGRDNVVVLGYGLWKQRFGGDPSVVGRTVTLGTKPYTVVGVMPESFRTLPPNLVSPGQFYRPVAEPHDEEERSSRHLRSIARLKPGVTVEQAQAEMNVIAGRLEREHPEANTGYGVRLVTLPEDTVGNLRATLWTLFGAVVFVLLIACANVGNLLLARSTARRKEFAVRAALGAGRARIVRQLLTESVLLALAGGAVGLLLALWGTGLIGSLGAQVTPLLAGVQLDNRVLAFTALVSVLSGLFFGLAPALQVSKVELNESLKEGGRSGGAGERGERLRSALIVSEVALALVLLACAGLLIKSVARLRAVDPGFRAERLLTANISLPSARYPSDASQAAFFERLARQLEAQPGVEAAGLTSVLPFSDNFDGRGLAVEDRPVPRGQEISVDLYIATPDYLRTMQIPLVEGRAIDEHDTADAAPVALVNETMARELWPGRDAIGRRVKFPGSQKNPQPWRTVVGVVRDVKQYGLDTGDKMQLYLPESQYPTSQMTVVMRASSDPSALLGALRGEVRAADKDLAVSDVATMDELLADSMALRRFSMLLLGLFASVALALAGVGIYGVMSYAVTQRTREIGLRMALGAQAGDVLRLVLRRGLRLACAGIALGTLGALLVTRVMSSLLFGVGARDPATFGSVAALLSAVALAACLVPARRATKVDPMVALRYE